MMARRILNRQSVLASIAAFCLVLSPLSLTATASAQSALSVLGVDAHKTLGSKSAPITMEVFSDFQCPMCKELYTTTMKEVVEHYVNTGKVYLIHRSFPLPQHAYALVAARYGAAAERIGKYEPVERVLFEKQEIWEQNGDVDGTVASVLSSTEMTKVRALVKGGKLDEEIDKDRALGLSYNISATPTCVIHCKDQTYPVSGFQSYPALRDFLDQLLSRK